MEEISTVGIKQAGRRQEVGESDHRRYRGMALAAGIPLERTG